MNELLKILHVIACGHLPITDDSIPRNVRSVFSHLLQDKGDGTPLLRSLLDRDPKSGRLTKPLVALRNAYYGSDFPKIICIHIQAEYGDGHVLPLRIDSHSTGYDISILQSLSGRNIVTQSPPQAIQCETFSVECDRRGIEAFIAAMSPSFKSENIFFQNFIETILQIHTNRDTIPAVKSEYATATILQRQGTCQGKAFKRSLRSFCESKVEYQTLMAMIMYELITECKQLENLDVNHQLLINQSIKNLARLLKKVQPNSAIFPIPDLIPITITTKLKELPETYSVADKITAELFSESVPDYPLVGRETTHIQSHWLDKLREDETYMFTIRVLKNNIRIHGALPPEGNSKFLDKTIGSLAKLAPSSFIGCVFAHVKLLQHINKYEALIKQKYIDEDQRALLQFLYERYLDIVSQSSFYIQMQKWSQTVTSNDFRHGCIYDIWAHVKERTEEIHQSYNRIFRAEELMSSSDVYKKFFPNALYSIAYKVPQSSPFYHLDLHPLTHIALLYYINWNAHNLTSKILRGIHTFIINNTGGNSPLVDYTQEFSARNLNKAHSTKYEFHNRKITRAQEVLFTGITMKEATLCNFDNLADPVIKQLLTLSSNLNPIVALDSITSFVASQTINIFNSLKALHQVDHEQIDSLEYINHILKRSGTLSTPQLHKIKSSEILLTQAIHHLKDNRFVEYALLIDTINTLLSSIISVEDLRPTDRFIELARENVRILTSMSSSKETVISTLNNLQEKYPLNALKIFAMILSTNETLDERQHYTTIFSHQVLLSQSVKSLVKRERFKNMVLQLQPFLRHSACNNTLFNKLSQSENWKVAVCTVNTPTLVILNLVNKEESRFSLVPSVHSSCAIERHYTQLGKNIFCNDPVGLILQRLDLSINPRDLTLHEGSYYFTYQERNYRIDHNDNIYLNINDKELYLIATNKQWLIFKEVDSSQLYLVLHKLASPEPILVSRSRRHYSYLEIMETSIPISCYSNSEHPTLAPLNQVIKVDDFELYPKYNLLLKYSQDRREIVPACHPDVHLLNDNAHNSLYTFATLSQLNLYNHIVFLNRDSQAQKVCLLSTNSHAFFSIKSDYLIPSNNQDFLFLCKELLSANTQYLSAFLMMKALPYFSPREEDSKEVVESIISSIFDLKNYIHPHWFVFINRLLSTVPQYQLSASFKLRNILKQYQHIATNLNADDINFFHAFRFATPLASAQWFQNKTSTEYITQESLAQIAYSSKLLTLCPTSDAAVNACKIYNKHGLHVQTFNSSTQAGYGDTKYPAYSLVKHPEAIHHVSLPRFISLGLCTSSMPITSLTGIVNPRPYEFFSEPFVKPITLTHSYTSSLQDNILKSIDASRDELESHGISQERFFTKLNDSVDSWIQECDKNIESYQHNQNLYSKHILETCYKVLNRLDLVSGKINLASDLEDDLICIEKLIKLCAFPKQHVSSKLGINIENASILKELLHQYLFQTVEIQFLNTVKGCLLKYQEDPADIGNANLLYSLLTTPRDPRLFSDSNYYPLLQYEHFSGFRARYGQMNLYTEVLKATNGAQKKQFIAELKPGSGKTSILPVIAVSQTLHNETVILEIPSALYSVQSKQIEYTIQQAYGLECYHLHKLAEISINHLKKLNLELEYAKKQGKIILSTFQDIQALRLQVMKIGCSSSPKVEKLLKFLKEATYFIDEVDQELSPTRVVNIPCGDKEPTSEEVQNFVAEAMRYVALSTPQLNTTMIPQGFHGAFPTDKTLSTKEVDKLITQILEHTPGTNTSLAQRLTTFIKMYHQVIFISKNNYTQSSVSDYEAVPAIGGIAIPNANFSDPITKLITSWLVINQQGMQKQKLKVLSLKFLDQVISDARNGIKRQRLDKFYTIFLERKLSRDAPARAIEIVNDISRISGEVKSNEDSRLDEIIELIFELSKMPSAYGIISEVFSEYIQELIFPHILTNTSRISLGPLDHHRGKIIGLTGTTHGYQALERKENEFPLNSNVVDTLSGDGNTLSRLLELEASKQLSFIPYNDFANNPSLWQGPYSAIIDNAKLINPTNIKNYIKELYSHIAAPWKIRCILFFIDNDFYGFCNGQVRRIKTTSSRDILEATGIPMEQCFMLYDSARTRGCDVALPTKAKGLLTIDVNTKLEDLIQAAMRLRKLGAGQTLSIVLTPALEEQVGAPSVANIIKCLSTKDTQRLMQSEFIASASQAIKSVFIEFVENSFLNSYGASKDSQFRILNRLITCSSAVEIDVFSQTLTDVEVKSRLLFIAEILMSMIEISYTDRKVLQPIINEIIKSKSRVCSQYMQSAAGNTESQTELSTNVEVQVQQALNYVERFDYSRAERDLPFKYQRISILYPKVTNSHIFISDDALQVAKTFWNDPIAKYAKELPFSHLIVCENDVIIISHNEAASEKKLMQKPYTMILSSDIDSIQTYPERIKKTIFESIVCLGQSLSLVHNLQARKIEVPLIVTWARNADNLINKSNLKVLEAISGNYLAELHGKMSAFVNKHSAFTNKDSKWENKRIFLQPLISQLPALESCGPMILQYTKFNTDTRYQVLASAIRIHEEKKAIYMKLSDDLKTNIRSNSMSIILKSEQSLGHNTTSLEQYIEKKYAMQRASKALVQAFTTDKAVQGAYQSIQHMIKSATIIKNIIRTQKDRAKFLEKKSKAIIIQRFIKDHAPRFHFLKLRSSTIKVQSLVRMQLARKRFNTQKQSAITIQRYYKGYLARKAFIKMKQSAISIQSYYRNYRAYKIHIRAKRLLLATTIVLILASSAMVYLGLVKPAVILTLLCFTALAKIIQLYMKPKLLTYSDLSPIPSKLFNFTISKGAAFNFSISSGLFSFCKKSKV